MSEPSLPSFLACREDESTEVAVKIMGWSVECSAAEGMIITVSLSSIVWVSICGNVDTS